MKLIIKISLLFALLSNAGAWYPEYTVLATDFVPPHDYLAPINIQSLGLQAMGSYFQNIYRSPIDDAFMNPAYLSSINKHYLYMDVAGDENPVSQMSDGYSIYAYDSYYPRYWSPYRYTVEPKDKEPLLRIVYLTKPFGKQTGIGMGITAEYYYGQEKYYQPYWYGWGWRMEDAIGIAYDENARDPYDDYRIVEEGDNTQTETGYRVNTFLSYALTSYLSLGFRYGLLTKKVNGDYRDLDFNDKSQWADDYIRYYDQQKERVQDYKMNDLSLGILFKTKKQSTYGLNVGYITGDIDRAFTESDSSKYYSYYFYGQDTSKYSRYYNHGNSFSGKNWLYDGNTRYGTAHADLVINHDLTLRFSIYSEQRKADLTESETMWRRNTNFSRNWNSWDSTTYRYENKSSASMTRTGTGDYQFDRYRLTFGTDWTLSPVIRFVGGFVIDKRLDEKSAVEPFVGDKYSFSYHTYGGESTTEWFQHDDKRFKWKRKEAYLTFAIPTGVIVNVGESFEFQVGLTKLMKKTDINEDYDLIVYSDSSIKIVNGTTITNKDSMYVEGHSLPGVHTFLEEYQMNAGLSFKYKDTFKITAAFRESILELEPRSFKIGAEFLW